MREERSSGKADHGGRLTISRRSELLSSEEERTRGTYPSWGGACESGAQLLVIDAVEAGLHAAQVCSAWSCACGLLTARSACAKDKGNIELLRMGASEARRACGAGRSAACANRSESRATRTESRARTEGDGGWLQSGTTARTRGIGSVFAGE